MAARRDGETRSTNNKTTESEHCCYLTIPPLTHSSAFGMTLHWLSTVSPSSVTNSNSIWFHCYSLCDDRRGSCLGSPHALARSSREGYRFVASDAHRAVVVGGRYLALIARDIYVVAVVIGGRTCSRRAPDTPANLPENKRTKAQNGSNSCE